MEKSEKKNIKSKKTDLKITEEMLKPFVMFNGNSIYIRLNSFLNQYPQFIKKLPVTDAASNIINSNNVVICTFLDRSTGNCQCNFINFYNYAGHHSAIKTILHHLYKSSDLLNLCFNSYLKSQINTRGLLLLDLKFEIGDWFEVLINKENIVIKNPYTSTNRSKMCIYLVKTNNLWKQVL